MVEPTVITGQIGSYEPHECWFEPPEDVHITCGYVLVAEDRGKPLSPGNTLRLAVAIFHAKTDTPAPDPVVYQVGGPGGHLLGLVPHIFKKTIAPFLKTRDLILFDPRGTGFSQPSLNCNEGEELEACIRRLFAEGRNLYAYNSSSMAADLQDIRRTLGYDQWNLVGESYGSHVAQITMHEQADGLRSVILDAVVPVTPTILHGNFSAFELSLYRLMKQYKQSSPCNHAYPDLEGQLIKAVSRLNRHPVTLTVDAYGSLRTTQLTGDRMVEMIREALYEVDLIPRIPYAIHAAAQGLDDDLWKDVMKLEAVIEHLWSPPVHRSVHCGDGKIAGCSGWPIAIEQKPVVSSIPTLLLSGEFDPVTPPDYAHSVAKSLTNSYVIDLPGFGHWASATGNPCANAIMQAFLIDPFHKPKQECIQELRDYSFYIPEG